MPIPHPLVLSKEWVHVMERHSSLFDIIEEEEEGGKEKLSDENSSPFEKDQNAGKDRHQDTLEADFAFESFFEYQLDETSLEREMVDKEYDQQSSSPSRFSKPDPEENFIISYPEVKEPIDSKDEEGIDQENQER